MRKIIYSFVFSMCFVRTMCVPYILILIYKNKNYVHPIYLTPPLGQYVTQGQFLNGVQQVLIQSFPSPRLVASSRLKNLVCPTIYP